MNKNSSEALGELINQYKYVHERWFSERPAPYTAIAFDAYYPEWGNPQKIQLVIHVVKVDGEADLQFLPQPYVLDITMEEMLAPKAKGASEPIGLIPKTFAYNEETQGIIERNLFDFLVTLLYNDILKSGERVIIFQGPFSPKLLGRLGYRHLTHDITLAGITFKNEWFPLTVPEANQRLNEDLGGSRFFVNVEKSCDTTNKIFYQLADKNASNGLEEVLKSWTLGDKNKTILMLELFCQFPSAVELPSGKIKSPWLTKIKIVQERLKFPGLVLDQGEPVWLPFALACAYDLCRHYGTRPFKDLVLIWKDYWEYLRFYEEDAKEMYSRRWEATEIVGRRSLLYLAMFSSQTYGMLQGKNNLQPAVNEFDRGNNLSSVIRSERTKGTWDIERWRAIA